MRSDPGAAAPNETNVALKAFTPAAKIDRLEAGILEI